MRTVHKYLIGDHSTLKMPRDARVLAVGYQGEAMGCLWAEVETENQPEDRRFRIYATGEPVDPQDTWVGTFQVGSYVWHVYEGLATRWYRIRVTGPGVAVDEFTTTREEFTRVRSRWAAGDEYIMLRPGLVVGAREMHWSTYDGPSGVTLEVRMK